MANKWRYADLTADARIEKIRGGDKDVYDSEIERSLDVIQSRNELGLDISEQKDWIDKVSYNYNLSNAEKRGISPDNVHRRGYADMRLGSSNDSEKSRNAPVTLTSKQADLKLAAKNYLEEFYQKTSDAMKQLSLTEEWLINNGIDKDSEEGRKFMQQAENEVAEKVEKYHDEYISAVQKKAASLDL